MPGDSLLPGRLLKRLHFRSRAFSTDIKRENCIGHFSLPSSPSFSCPVELLLFFSFSFSILCIPTFLDYPVCTWPLDISFCFAFSLPVRLRDAFCSNPLRSLPLTGSRFGTQAVFCSLAASPEFHSAAGFRSKSGSKWALYKSSLI